MSKKACDCAVICKNLICLVEIKCGKIRAGDPERDIAPQLDEIEGFLRRRGLADREFQRIAVIRSYPRMLRRMIQRRLLQKRIRAHVLTPSASSLRIRTGSSTLILEFIVG